jgi:hypothetical protein
MDQASRSITSPNDCPATEPSAAKHAGVRHEIPFSGSPSSLPLIPAYPSSSTHRPQPPALPSGSQYAPIQVGLNGQGYVGLDDRACNGSPQGLITEPPLRPEYGTRDSTSPPLFFQGERPLTQQLVVAAWNSAADPISAKGLAEVVQQVADRAGTQGTQFAERSEGHATLSRLLSRGSGAGVADEQSLLPSSVGLVLGNAAWTGAERGAVGTQAAAAQEGRSEGAGSWGVLGEEPEAQGSKWRRALVAWDGLAVPLRAGAMLRLFDDAALVMDRLSRAADSSDLGDD